MTLPITKKQFNNSVVQFIKLYQRLPFLSEDDVEIEIINDDSKKETRSYRAGRYVNEFYESQDNMIKELFDNKILTNKIVCKYTKIKDSRLTELLSEKATKVENSERRSLEVFFNKDYYENLGKYNKKYCEKCTKKKKCGSAYWVNVISCSNFTKSKKKQKI